MQKRSETQVRLHIKCSLLWSSFSQNWNISIKVRLPRIKVHESLSATVESLRGCKQTERRDEANGHVFKKNVLEVGARNDMIFPVIDQSTSN